MLLSLTAPGEIPCDSPKVELISSKREWKYLFPDPKSNHIFSFTFVNLPKEYLKVIEVGQATSLKTLTRDTSQYFNVSPEQVTLNAAASFLFGGTQPMEDEALMVLKRTIKRTAKRSPSLPFEFFMHFDSDGFKALLPSYVTSTQKERLTEALGQFKEGSSGI